MDIEPVYSRICTECKNELPATEEYFHYRRNGFLNLAWQCRDCANAASRKRQAQYGGEPQKRYRDKYPLKTAAHDALRSATMTGKIAPIAERACADCGCAATDYHHEDYNKPLEVMPVCRRCHGLRHRKC